MSEKMEDGGPAFPLEGRGDHKRAGGMSLRDWYAAHAMQAALTNSSASSEGSLVELFQTVAKLSYAAADAMIAARKAGA